MKTHHGSTTVRWLFIINLLLVFECCWKYFPPHDQAYYCSQQRMNACFIFWHSWACPSAHLSAWSRYLSLLSGCLPKRPFQFQICNQKLHFEFHFYFYLKFIIFERTPGLGQLSQNLRSQWHFYKSEYLRQKASDSNILKKTNKQRFWHWEPTKWQLGFRASFWVVVKLSIWIFFEILEMNFLSVYK